MTDSNPFDDLAETSDDKETDKTQKHVDKPQRQTHQAPVNEQNSSPSSDKLGGPTLQNSSPPFPFSDTDQNQMYVQRGFWEDLEDLKFDAELHLRRHYDVRNVEQRELDTAITRILINQLTSSQIADKVIEMRGFDPKEHPE